MIENLRAELGGLKQRQAQLSSGLDLLRVQIEALEKRISDAAAAQALAAQRPSGSEGARSQELPPVLPIDERREVQARQKPETQRDVALTAPHPAGSHEEASACQSVPPPLMPAEPPASRVSDRATRRPESFEMRLGTYWLVRIGIVAMLTALVFFGSYAYQNYIEKLGPAGKVALLYVASGTLLGFGAWFQRRAARDSLRNYAQVLTAGGMAAVYFTTYAAHHFSNLRVIQSAVMDGALLLGWAGFIAWTADRKKSEVMALFAVGLAYYTSVITRVGHFTLYSNLVLAAAVVYFLVRNRWAKLSYASLVATYASYGFWRFHVGEHWQWAGPDAGLWGGICFLPAYWAVFTSGAFLSRHEWFSSVNRASFITLNNAAGYVMSLLTILQTQSGGFWKLNLITGAALLAAAGVARIRFRNEPLAGNTYLAHGLLLVTLGVIARFNHEQSILALVLCLESVVLWLTGTMRGNLIMRTGACLAGALATLWALDGIQPNDVPGVWLAVGVGGLLGFNAFWSHRRERGDSLGPFRAGPTYFSSLALVVWSVGIWQNVGVSTRPAAYALLVIAAMTAAHITRLRELGMLAQLVLAAAAGLFILNVQSLNQVEPVWVFAGLGGVALGLVHWWQWQSLVGMGCQARRAGQFLMALVFAGVTSVWLEPLCEARSWLMATSGLLLVMTAYGAWTRNGMLALVGQGFAALSLLSFFLHAGTAELEWWAALVPVASLSVLGMAGVRWAAAQGSQYSNLAVRVRRLARWYGRVTLVLVAWWTFQYVDVRELVWSFTALGSVAFALSGRLRHRDLLVFAAALNICALGSLFHQLASESAVYGPNFLCVLVWMAEQQVVRRQPERWGVPALAHNTAMIAAALALWWLTSNWVQQGFSGFYLTASWSLYAFAIFGAGISLQERIYRWLGLAFLGAALTRVVLFDVWKLDTPYRILSFFALGLVLLVLGFIYNKYQERIRQWL